MSSSTEKPESTLSTGVSRLVRSLSRNATKSADVASPLPRTSSATSVSNEPATKNTDVRGIPKQKLTAFERFTQLGKKKDKKPEFPPSSWFDGKTEPSVTAEATPLVPSTLTSENGKTVTGEASEMVIEQDDVVKESMTEEVERAPEPTFLARKIQDMISALPVLSAYSSSSSLSSPKAAVPSTANDTPASLPLVDGANGSPPMPPPAPITDSKLISLLSSATIMNGSLSKGRQSVWSVLDRLRSPTAKSAAKGPSQHSAEEEDDDDDDSSVMMYAPLEPDASSEVEIARSEICSIDEEGEVIAERPGEDMNKPEMPPKGTDKAGQGSSSGEGEGKGKAVERAKKVKEVRVWVPSTEKISLQATWWGYRLYLPPPVLDILNNKQLEAAKRAAIMTTALKWLLDRIPVKLFPPQFRPILMALKRLAPYLGYIGVFIAWSWGAIKAFDKGNGVILTATWLLPVALIPGTWDDDMVQPPPPPPKDINPKKLIDDNKPVKVGAREARRG